MPERPYAAVYAPIAQRITQARLERGMTQADLGAAAGLSRPVITMIETVHRRIDAHQLLALARALDVDVCWLLGYSHTHDQDAQDDVPKATAADDRIDDLAARVSALERALGRAGLSV